MEKLGLNEIRKLFRDFYVSKGHYAAKSASLIPKDDNSLLIINSGMAPLKKYFAGLETPPSKRMTTCQKCIRTGDIDNVGITARHGTFFEMLGNFSFGDYFKRESLTWGLEFMTEWLHMPFEKIWVTVYEDDEEAVEIWKSLGMPEERIVRLARTTTSGRSGSDHADHAQSYILTEGRNTAAASLTASRAATATAIWNSGTTFLRSFPRKRTAAIRRLRIQI